MGLMDFIKGQLIEIIEWTDGAFEIDFSGKSSERTISRSTQGLLMEGLRLMDEARRGAEA